MDPRSRRLRIAAALLALVAFSSLALLSGLAHSQSESLGGHERSCPAHHWSHAAAGAVPAAVFTAPVALSQLGLAVARRESPATGSSILTRPGRAPPLD
jgi:hypothetical protein